jgi:hypothetical protein
MGSCSRRESREGKLATDVPGDGFLLPKDPQEQPNTKTSEKTFK